MTNKLLPLMFIFAIFSNYALAKEYKFKGEECYLSLPDDTEWIDSTNHGALLGLNSADDTIAIILMTQNIPGDFSLKQKEFVNGLESGMTKNPAIKISNKQYSNVSGLTAYDVTGTMTVNNVVSGMTTRFSVDRRRCYSLMVIYDQKYSSTSPEIKNILNSMRFTTNAREPSPSTVTADPISERIGKIIGYIIGGLVLFAIARAARR